MLLCRGGFATGFCHRDEISTPKTGIYSDITAQARESAILHQETPQGGNNGWLVLGGDRTLTVTLQALGVST